MLPLDCYLRRMGWSHVTPDGWISLSHSYKRNIAGRVIATETDPAWQRDIQLAQMVMPANDAHDP